MDCIYADTALAPAGDISDYVSRYGCERLMFGSDFPFGDPAFELQKILRMNLTGEQKEAITGGNAARLLEASNRQTE
jgi:predicted TIM-barrel fold metal-dependent hydrolase